MDNIKYSVAFQDSEGNHLARKTMSAEEYIQFLQCVVRFLGFYLGEKNFKEEYPSEYFTTEIRKETYRSYD